jgi:Lrp/AsnC family transcriptional regulator, regulator for asnA, asnC and gidA
MIGDLMDNKPELDDVDLAILKLLRQNSRMSYLKMSRVTGISDATIQFRLKRMIERGVIGRFTVALSPKASDYTVLAIVLVQTDTNKHENAKLALAEITEVSEVYGVLGEYDLLIKVWSRSLEELNAVINEKIRSVDGIEDLLEIVVIDRVKEEMPPV